MLKYIANPVLNSRILLWCITSADAIPIGSRIFIDDCGCNRKKISRASDDLPHMRRHTLIDLVPLSLYLSHDESL